MRSNLWSSRAHGRDDLTDQSVQVGVSWTFDVQVTSADVVDGLVVDHEGTVRVLQGGMGGEDGVVGLDDGGGDLWGWVDGKLELGLLAIVDRETLHQKGGESGSSSSTERVEDKETLETGTLISQFSNSVEDEVDDFLTNGVVTTGVVVSGIFFAGDQLFGVEKLSVGSGADLVNDGGFQIDEDGTWDVLTSAGLGEEGVERVVTSSDGLVRWHLSVRLDAVLPAVKLPASITDLNTSLSDVDGNTLSHFSLFFRI